MNLQIARACLTATDHILVTRTWSDVMETLIKQKQETNNYSFELSPGLANLRTSNPN